MISKIYSRRQLETRFSVPCRVGQLFASTNIERDRERTYFWVFGFDVEDINSRFFHKSVYWKHLLLSIILQVGKFLHEFARLTRTPEATIPVMTLDGDARIIQASSVNISACDSSIK
jgi:hypothetical protein